MLKDETIARVLRFRDDRDWLQFHTPKDLAISLSLEAAELLEVFQWSGTDLQCEEKRDKIREELAGPMDTQSRPGILPANRPHSRPAWMASTLGSQPYCSR